MQTKYRLLLPDAEFTVEDAENQTHGQTLGWGDLAGYFDAPTLSEAVRLDQAKRLHELYPTQKWTALERRRRPFRRFPRTLFDHCKGPFSTTELMQGYLAYRTFQDRVQQIDLILDALEGKIKPSKLLSRIYRDWPVVLLLHAFRASFARADQHRLLERALVSPMAAYALSTSVPLDPGQWLSLTDRIAESPRHIYEYIRSVSPLPNAGALPEHAHTMLETSPLYYTLTAHQLQGARADVAITAWLKSQAATSAEAAALMLARNPQGRERPQWLAMVSTSPWWAYQLGFIWSSVAPDVSNEHRSLLQAAVIKEPSAAYHWLRDVTPEDPGLIAQTWTSPFVLDLAEDQGWTPAQWEHFERTSSGLGPVSSEMKQATERWLAAKRKGKHEK